jgi:hypothetical protein
MLFRRKMKAVDKVTGLNMPRITFLVSILSRTSVVATRSDLTRAMARSFSSCVSQRAVAGRSVRVIYATRERQHVIMPSMAKIIRQLWRPPK